MYGYKLSSHAERSEVKEEPKGSERTLVCYLYTHWLFGILNSESRISDIEFRISNDPSGISHYDN
jgi:hypothetical protein